MKVISSWQHRQKAISPNKTRLENLIVEIAKLANLDLTEDETVSVNFVGPRIMRKINRDFLNHDYLTDVICFNYRQTINYNKDYDIAVEIFISPTIAEERANEDSSLNYESELLLYLVHAILHASGLNDKSTNDKQKMRAAEQSILQALVDKKITSPFKKDSC